MAASIVEKTLYDGLITLSDGTGTPVTLVVPFSIGNLKVSGLSQTLREVLKFEARGVLTSVRLGKRRYPTGSFSFQVADYSDATNQTVIDFLLKTGSYSANISTLGSAADVYAVTIKLTVEGTDRGDSADHTVTMTNCVCTLDVEEGEPNMGSVSFEILGAVTFT